MFNHLYIYMIPYMIAYIIYKSPRIPHNPYKCLYIPLFVRQFGARSFRWRSEPWASWLSCFGSGGRSPQTIW